MIIYIYFFFWSIAIIFWSIGWRRFVFYSKNIVLKFLSDNISFFFFFSWNELCSELFGAQPTSKLLFSSKRWTNGIKLWKNHFLNKVCIIQAFLELSYVSGWFFWFTFFKTGIFAVIYQERFQFMASGFVCYKKECHLIFLWFLNPPQFIQLLL